MNRILAWPGRWFRALSCDALYALQALKEAKSRKLFTKDVNEIEDEVGIPRSD